MPSPADRPGIANATQRQAYSSGASHGKVIARLVPDYQRKAADACRDLWAEAGEIDLAAPEDRAAEAVSALDD
ncbi:hypothetical protein BN1110_05750 [bacterium YEK0313]|nr:hypothetical protein BN1110_05750 [bacterium YEK0313]